MGRYQGSFLGVLWSFFNPILMLGVLTFFFTEIFNAKWRPGSETKGEFAVALFAGLIFYYFFSECASRAPVTVVSQQNYVKKIVFPLEIFSVVNAGSALFHFGISTIVLLIFQLFLGNGIPVTFLYLPLILLPLYILGIATGWLLSALGVYFRDLPQIVSVYVLALMYISPLFFDVTAMPEKFRFLMNLSPLTVLINEGRKVMVWGQQPDFPLLATYTAIVSVVALVSFAIFQKLRRGFADVL